MFASDGVSLHGVLPPFLRLIGRRRVSVSSKYVSAGAVKVGTGLAACFPHGSQLPAASMGLVVVMRPPVPVSSWNVLAFGRPRHCRMTGGVIYQQQASRARLVHIGRNSPRVIPQTFESGF